MKTKAKKLLKKIFICALKMKLATIVPIDKFEPVLEELIEEVFNKYVDISRNIPAPNDILCDITYENKEQIIDAVNDIIEESDVIENIEIVVCSSVDTFARQIISASSIIAQHEEVNELKIFDALCQYLKELQDWAMSNPPLIVSVINYLYSEINTVKFKLHEQEISIKKHEELIERIENDTTIPELKINWKKYELYLISHMNTYIANDTIEMLFQSYLGNYKNDYIMPNILFNEIDRFVSKNWTNILFQMMEKESAEYCFIEDFIKKNASSMSDASLVTLLIQEIKQVSNNSKYKEELFARVLKYLEDICLEKCMLISGYYGSGKTRFIMELVKLSLTRKKITAHQRFTNNVRFLYVNCQKKDDIKENIKKELQLLFQSENSNIEDYLKVFSSTVPLVVVLDDVHEYLQNGKSPQDILSIIIEYSRLYVKWIIMIQPDYSTSFEIGKISLWNKYSYQFSVALRKYQYNNWFQLHDWNKDKKIVDKIIYQLCNVDDWKWKNNVCNTSFYNPLFARVLLLYNMLYSEKTIFLRNNLFYPEFCSMYYDIMSRKCTVIDQTTRVFAKYFLESNSLVLKNVELEKEITQSMCNDLLNHGLLLRTIKKYDRYYTYEGIPDIVWYFQMAVLAKQRWENSDNILQVNLIKEEKLPKNQWMFNKIISMVVIMIVEIASDENDYVTIKQLWKTLLDSGLEQSLFEVGFKINQNLRRNLIKLVLEYDAILHDNFETFLHLCSLGGLSASLLYKIIDSSLKNNRDALKVNIDLFAYMLQRNYDTLTYKQLLVVFSKLHTLAEIISNDKNVLTKLGQDLAELVVMKSDEKGELDAAIADVLVAIENDRKIERIDAKFPSNLCDYFSQYFGNYVIARYGIFAYKKIQKVGWYTFKKKLSWNQRRRNISLTFSLAYVYRHTSDSEYSKWYESFVTELSESKDDRHKEFALYLIAHSGFKDNNYEIKRYGRLRKIALKLYFCENLQYICNKGSLKKFYSENFSELNKHL